MLGEKLQIAGELIRRAMKDTPHVGVRAAALLLYAEASTRRPLTILAPRDPMRLIRLGIPGGTTPFFARYGTSDLDAYRQVFIWREYLDLLRVESPKVIVDCGANVGASSAYLLTAFPKSNVVAIEPEPGNFELCCKNLAPFGNRARVIRAAIWPKDHRLTLVKSPRQRGEWAFAVTPAENDAGNVRAVSMSGLLDECGIDSIDILKVDIEGAERALFADDSCKTWLRRVRNIAIELHDQSCDLAFRSALRTARFNETRRGEITYILNLQLEQLDRAAPKKSASS